MFLLVPGVMAVWDLVDAVFDYGDYLLVKNRGAENRIMLSNIMNVSSSTFMNPPRITLKLVRPSKLGRERASSIALTGQGRAPAIPSVLRFARAPADRRYST